MVQLLISLSLFVPLQKAGQQGGDHEMAALLQRLAAIAAIVTIPLMAALFRQVFSIQG
jgi:hypothetical protein